MSERSEDSSLDDSSPSPSSPRRIEVLDEPPPMPPGFAYACRTGKRKTVVPKLKAPKPKRTALPKPPKAAAPKRTKKFRFQSASLFATFPQCTVTKEQAMKNVLDKWLVDTSFVIVAHEQHESGDDHLHVLVKFKAQKDFSSPDFADFITGQHGNYQPARNIKNVITYVTKDDDFITHGTVPQISGKKESKFDLIATLIQEGVSQRDIRRQYPGLYMMYAGKITTFFSVVKQDVHIESLLPWHCGLVPDKYEDPSGYAVANWLNENIKKPREFKKAQLWLHGPANAGKTSLVLMLQKYLRVYTVLNDEDFMDGFDEDNIDLVIFDEFRAQKRITWMNQFIEGSRVSLRVKGSRAFKTINLPVIVLSNYSIEGCYHKADHVAVSTIKARFTEVEITDYQVDHGYFLKIVHNDSVSAVSEEEDEYEVDTESE